LTLIQKPKGGGRENGRLFNQMAVAISDRVVPKCIEDAKFEIF
jgi:hypothetical protein